MAIETFANTPTPASPSTPWTTLSGSINSSVTALTVVAHTAFPQTGQFRILIESEWILVTAGAGTTTWTVTRGIEGSTAASHASGVGIFHVVTAAALLRVPGPMTTLGDTVYMGAAGAPTRLAAPSDGDYSVRWTTGVPSWQAAAGGGSVSSVALSVPGFLSVAGSPVTTSGTLAVSLATQAANLIFAGPNTGSAAAPTFRSLVAADIPSLSVYVAKAGDTMTGPLALTITNTGTSGEISNATGQLIANPTADSSAGYNGFKMGVESQTGNVRNLTGNLTSFFSSAYHQGSGSLALLRGLYVDTESYGGGGVVAQMTGAQVYQWTSDPVTLGRGLWIGPDVSSTGLFTTYEGLYINDLASLNATTKLAINYADKFIVNSAGALAIASGTITASAPALDVSQTWNDGAVMFTGLKFNATSTASAASSLLLDLQLAGVSKFSVTKLGGVTIASGAGPLDVGGNIYSHATLFFGSGQDVSLERSAATILQLGDGSGSTGGTLELLERTLPSAPAADRLRFYAVDVGGKTALMARFATGSPVQVAIEP